MPDPDASAPLQIEGEVLSGRLVIYADTLAIELGRLAETLSGIDPLVLDATGQTAARIVGQLAAQMADAALAFGTSTDDEAEQ